MTKAIERVMDEISSYQIFNYLFPGIVFINLLEKTTSFRVAADDVVCQLFLYYLVGMILSRIGSIVIEPLYKGMCWVIFAKYNDFISASKKDDKIEIISMENNTYRTLVSTFFCLIVAKGLDQCAMFREFNSSGLSTCVYFVILTLIFSMSYAKQTAYVRKSVHKALNIDDKETVEHLKKVQKQKFKEKFLGKNNKNTVNDDSHN